MATIDTGMLLDDQTPEVVEMATRIANDYGISPQDLWWMYCNIMGDNLFVDLDDIARENLEELKEMSGE